MTRDTVHPELEGVLAPRPAGLVDPIDAQLVSARVEARLFGGSPRVSVGRYFVTKLVGRGGGGTVYRGDDPRLRRTVAIKIVRIGPHSSLDEAGVREEARTLARLSHPNVVEVFDVFTTDEGDGVVIVMEWVDGVPLDAWLRQDARSSAQVLEVLLAAGRGLAAVHEQGIVHRDFKPGNVLVDGSARVKVTDFGLATVVETMTATLPTSTRPRFDRVVGTPAYMAPEQLRGTPVDARADLYAFCSTAFEALTGGLPGRDPSVEGQLVSALRARGLARPAARAIARGLRNEPDRRPPSMQALLAELTAGERVGWRLATGGAGLVVAAALVWMAMPKFERSCRAEARAVSERWAERRTDLGPTHAFDRIDASASEFGRTWASAYETTCTFGDPMRRARAQRCLERVAAELWHRVELLEREPTAEFEAAPTPTMRSHGHCVEHDDLLGWAPPNPAQHGAVDALLDRWAAMTALAAAGRTREALAGLQDVLRKARATGYDELVLLVEMEYGRLLAKTGELELAVDMLSDAYTLAAAGNHDPEAARTASHLAFAVGYKLARPDEGRQWARHAQAAMDRARLDGRWRAAILRHLGSIERGAGNLDSAVAHQREALAILRSSAASEPELVAGILNNLANVELARGNLEVARRHQEEAIDIGRRTSPGQRLDVATSLNNLANIHLLGGRIDEARIALTEALAILESTHHRDGAEVVYVTVNLSELAIQEGAFEVAEAHARRAVEIANTELGPSDPATALARYQFANVLHEVGEIERALAEYTAAHTAWLAIWGPQHADVALVLNAMGLAERALGHHRRAAEHFAEAKRVYLATVGPDHANTLITTINLGLQSLYVRAGAPAREQLLAVLEHPEFSKLPASSQRDAEFGLARALWSEAGQRGRAIELAERAAAHATNERPQILEWLARHRVR